MVEINDDVVAPDYKLPEAMKKFIDDYDADMKYKEELKNTQIPAIADFRKEMGLSGKKAPKFKGNDIEFQAEIEKLIKNNPVAQVAIKDMMARSGGDLSKIMNNLQRNDKLYNTNTRGQFQSYTYVVSGLNPVREDKTALYPSNYIRPRPTYDIRYNATDVFDAKTDKGETFVSLLEELRDKGESYPNITKIYDLNAEGKKEFNNEYYNSLSDLQKTIIQIQADNKGNSLRTIVHELTHYGFKTLNDRGYIDDATFKNLSSNQNFGFDYGISPFSPYKKELPDGTEVPHYSKEHILIKEFLAPNGSILPQTDLQRLSQASMADLNSINKKEAAEEFARREVNEALLLNSIDNPNVDVSTRDPNRGPYTSLYFRNYYNKNQGENNVPIFQAGDENDMNEIERTAYDKIVEKYLNLPETEFDRAMINFYSTEYATDVYTPGLPDYFGEKTNPLLGTEPMETSTPQYQFQKKKKVRSSAPFNLDYSNATRGGRGNAAAYVEKRLKLEPEQQTIITNLKNSAETAANQWLSENDNPETIEAKNDLNPRLGYESGQDYLNETKNNFFEPETYTGPVPELMAEGGPVMALEEQTEMAFGAGPSRVDPVSGNEVPPGALPEEVRDDIPARLSEGEYVVPADVLQFFGIKFFEDLRTQAKTELAGLESNGRMGGEPVEDQEELPFSLDELETFDDEQPIDANKGGMIRGYEPGGLVTEMSTGTASVVKTYVNEAGLKMYIRFINGIAVPPVPPGYFEEGAAVTPVETVAPVQSEEGENNPDNGPPVKLSLADIIKSSLNPPMKLPGFGMLGAASKIIDSLFPTNSTSQIMAYVNKYGTLPASGRGVKAKPGQPEIGDGFAVHPPGHLLEGTIVREMTSADTIKPGELNTFRTIIFPAYKNNTNEDGTLNSKGYSNTISSVIGSDGTVMGTEKTFTPGTTSKSFQDASDMASDTSAKGIVARDKKVKELMKPYEDTTPVVTGDNENADNAQYSDPTGGMPDKDTARGQAQGKGYIGGAGFNKGGLASKRKKK